MRTPITGVKGINYTLLIFSDQGEGEARDYGLDQIKTIINCIANSFSMYTLWVDAEYNSLLEEWAIRIRWYIQGRRLGIDLNLEFLRLQRYPVQMVAQEFLHEIKTALLAIDRNDRN